MIGTMLRMIVSSCPAVTIMPIVHITAIPAVRSGISTPLKDLKLKYNIRAITMKTIGRSHTISDIIKSETSFNIKGSPPK